MSYSVALISSLFSTLFTEKRIDYYGDPLRDFGLPHFLGRFAFKNPKKLDYQPAVEGAAASTAHKRYTSYGARGKPVKSLTKATCTEDEMFIFNYLEHKRKQAELVDKSKKEPKVEEETAKAEGDDDLKEGEVDDDEFESYLDGFFGKKAKEGEGEADEDELNFLEELGGELQADNSKKKQKKKKDDDEEDEDMADDWEDDGADDDEELSEGGEQSDDETGSIDLQPMDEDDDDDDGKGSISMDGGDSDTSDAPESPDEEDEEEDDEDAPKSKKSRKETQLNERSFANKLKHSSGAFKSYI